MVYIYIYIYIDIVRTCALTYAFDLLLKVHNNLIKELNITASKMNADVSTW